MRWLCTDDKAGVVGVSAARIGRVGFKRAAAESVRRVAKVEDRAREAQLLQDARPLAVAFPVRVVADRRNRRARTERVSAHARQLQQPRQRRNAGRIADSLVGERERAEV